MVYSKNGKQIFYYLTPTKDRQMTTTTPDNIPTGKSVTAKFDDIDTADTKRIIDTNKDTMRWIRTDGAWYELGLIMINLREHVENEGGTRITTKMLKDDPMAKLTSGVELVKMKVAKPSAVVTLVNKATLPILFTV